MTVAQKLMAQPACSVVLLLQLMHLSILSPSWVRVGNGDFLKVKFPIRGAQRVVNGKVAIEAKLIF